MATGEHSTGTITYTRIAQAPSPTHVCQWGSSLRAGTDTNWQEMVSVVSLSCVTAEKRETRPFLFHPLHVVCLTQCIHHFARQVTRQATHLGQAYPDNMPRRCMYVLPQAPYLRTCQTQP